MRRAAPARESCGSALFAHLVGRLLENERRERLQSEYEFLTRKYAGGGCGSPARADKENRANYWPGRAGCVRRHHEARARDRLPEGAQGELEREYGRTKRDLSEAPSLRAEIQTLNRFHRFLRDRFRRPDRSPRRREAPEADSWNSSDETASPLRARAAAAAPTPAPSESDALEERLRARLRRVLRADEQPVSPEHATEARPARGVPSSSARRRGEAIVRSSDSPTIDSHRLLSPGPLRSPPSALRRRGRPSPSPAGSPLFRSPGGAYAVSSASTAETAASFSLSSSFRSFSPSFIEQILEELPDGARGSSSPTSFPSSRLSSHFSTTTPSSSSRPATSTGTESSGAHAAVLTATESSNTSSSLSKIVSTDSNYSYSTPSIRESPKPIPQGSVLRSASRSTDPLFSGRLARVSEEPPPERKAILAPSSSLVRREPVAQPPDAAQGSGEASIASGVALSSLLSSPNTSRTRLSYSPMSPPPDASFESLSHAPPEARAETAISREPPSRPNPPQRRPETGDLAPRSTPASLALSSAAASSPAPSVLKSLSSHAPAPPPSLPPTTPTAAAMNPQVDRLRGQTPDLPPTPPSSRSCGGPRRSVARTSSPSPSRGAEMAAPGRSTPRRGAMATPTRSRIPRSGLLSPANRPSGDANSSICDSSADRSLLHSPASSQPQSPEIALFPLQRRPSGGGSGGTAQELAPSEPQDILRLLNLAAEEDLNESSLLGSSVGFCGAPGGAQGPLPP